MPTNRIICAKPREVEALLNGRLTTFWRPVKPPPPEGADFHAFDANGLAWFCVNGEITEGSPVRCPYGQPGDTLAIKETWAGYLPGHSELRMQPLGYRIDRWIKGPVPARQTDTGKVKMVGPVAIIYRASGAKPWHSSWRSPAVMPRWAVRPGFTRPIVEVRVVRVQEISATDVEAAGIDVAGKLPALVAPGTDMERLDALVEVVARKQFERDWDARYANTPYAWSENPPAWAITIGGCDGN